jgi:DNA-binding transcriptional regulator/RsmH inhibitor MraZ
MEQSITGMMASLRPPRGHDSVKADGAGRVKLPASIVEHIHRLLDKSLFATVLYGQIRIYTNGAWERNLERLNSQPALKKAMYAMGNINGADVTMDGQGRITFPQKIRDLVPIEGQSVHLMFIEDVLMVSTTSQHESTVEAESRNLEEKKGVIESLGFV